jgi:hypothetical protein
LMAVYTYGLDTVTRYNTGCCCISHADKGFMMDDIIHQTQIGLLTKKYRAFFCYNFFLFCSLDFSKACYKHGGYHLCCCSRGLKDISPHTSSNLVIRIIPISSS